MKMEEGTGAGDGFFAVLNAASGGAVTAAGEFSCLLPWSASRSRNHPRNQTTTHSLITDSYPK
jgi:hypothetical protein